MPTATLEDYLARMQPYAPKPRAQVQVPQVQQVNPLQMMVAQQLMTALQPQQSVTPSVPKNSMWITPQMIQGAAQTNVAEQRLAQNQQALGQHQIGQALQQQQGQQRMAMDQARLQNELNQPDAAEEAQLKAVQAYLANEMMVERQKEIESTRLQHDKDLAAYKNELPLTPEEQEDRRIRNAYTQALTGNVGAGGAGGAGGEVFNSIYELNGASWLTPQQKQQIAMEKGWITDTGAPLSGLVDAMAQGELSRLQLGAEAAKSKSAIAKAQGGKQMSEATARWILSPNNWNATEEQKAAAEVVLGLADAVTQNSLPKDAVIEWEDYIKPKAK